MIARALGGAAIAAGIAIAARRTGSLSSGGAVAASVVGTVAMAAGWGWGALLIAYFAASALLTRWGAPQKEARTGAIVEKGGARDAWQVIANGGVFALAALGAAALGAFPVEVSAFGARVTVGGGAPGDPDAWRLIGAGALAAAAADTWSTELGTMFGGTPRSLVSGTPVPVGTSGGITPWGSLGALLGGAFVALVAVACGWRAVDLAPIAFAGIVGAFADSLLGDTVQARRVCSACGAFTERGEHDCGASTTPAGGWRWMTNDAVNLVATLVGAATALISAHALAGA